MVCIIILSGLTILICQFSFKNNSKVAKADSLVVQTQAVNGVDKDISFDFLSEIKLTDINFKDYIKVSNIKGEIPKCRIKSLGDKKYKLLAPENGYVAGETYSINLYKTKFVNDSISEERPFYFSIDHKDVVNVVYKNNVRLMLEHTNSAESIMLGLEKAILDNRKNFCEHFEMQVYRSLASLYDFVNDAPKTIVYFNKSLKLSAHLKADDYLYSLYRQSSICSPLNEARSLMDIAYKKFVEKNNLIEIAKCAHNISTDALYLNNPSDCEKYAEISLKTFERYGSLEKVSTLNTLAIYYAIYQQDTKKAKSTLQSALKIANSDWVKITVLNNLNTVAVMENDEEESLKYVKQIETLYRNEMPVARNYVDFSYALYFKLIGNSDEAKNRLTSIINYEKSEYRHKTLAALFYNDLSMNKLHITVDHEIYGYLKKCHDANSFWGTVRFWET